MMRQTSSLVQRRGKQEAKKKVMSHISRELDPLGAALREAAPAPPTDLAQMVMARIAADALPRERGVDRLRQSVGRRWRLALAALVVSLPLGATAGAVTASAHSLPGDLLYGVRTARESLVLALTPDPAARDVLALDFAAQRGPDLRRALSQHAGAPVVHAVLRSILDYDRLVPFSDNPIRLGDALRDQYRAVQQAHQQVTSTASWLHDSTREVVVQDLTDTASAVKMIARHDGAAWAQAGQDIPAHSPDRDPEP